MRHKIKIIIKHYVGDTWSYSGYEGPGCILFQNTFENTTEGITEFTGAIHGLMYIKKKCWYGDVVIKNPYIKDCIEAQQYKHKPKGEKASEFYRRCYLWMLENKASINIELYNEKETANTK